MGKGVKSKVAGAETVVKSAPAKVRQKWCRNGAETQGRKGVRGPRSTVQSSEPAAGGDSVRFRNRCATCEGKCGGDRRGTGRFFASMDSFAWIWLDLAGFGFIGAWLRRRRPGGARGYIWLKLLKTDARGSRGECRVSWCGVSFARHPQLGNGACTLGNVRRSVLSRFSTGRKVGQASCLPTDRMPAPRRLATRAKTGIGPAACVAFILGMLGTLGAGDKCCIGSVGSIGYFLRLLRFFAVESALLTRKSAGVILAA